MRTFSELTNIDDPEEMTNAEKLLIKYTELAIYAPRVQELKDDGVSEEVLCACIYGLFSDYLITEETEEELYKIADYYENVSSPSACWYEYNGEQLLA